jgi:hypothetical protein
VGEETPSGEVPECAATPCDRFNLTVHLPPGIWNHKPGGLQVAIRWERFPNNLRLFVYRNGTLIATSAGIVATAQSVLIPMAENGDYAVYVAYDPDSPDPAIPYEGIAEVEYAAQLHPLRPLLPDLIMRPHRNVTFRSPPPFPVFNDAPPPGANCFRSEIAEEGARLCLRFDQVIANIGEGPLELRSALPHVDPLPPTGNIIQRIIWSDGDEEQRPGGTWEFHPAHGHFHYTGFALSRLFAANEAGEQIGLKPQRERRHRILTMRQDPSREAVVTGRKVSVCVVDIEIDAWGEKGDGPRTYNAPDCLFPQASDANFDYLIQGLTPGWADVYDWFLPDQYLDVAGLPDGFYILETIADPDNTVLEAHQSNNCGSVLIRLSNMATSPTVELLGPRSSCSASVSERELRQTDQPCTFRGCQ